METIDRLGLKGLAEFDKIMNISVTRLLFMATPSVPASSAIVTQTWAGITVEYGRLHEVGEFDFAMPKQCISVAFAPHDRVTWSIDGGARQTTPLPAGSAFIYGGREFTWHQRDRVSEYVNLMLEPSWLNTMAIANGLPADVCLDRRVIFVDPTILHVAQLLRSEVKQGGLGGNLYVESLRNLLAIHLLRNYSQTAPITKPPAVAIDRLQLKQIEDYIEANLAENLTITDLAASIHISQFHFARAFKSATGEPPHRYITNRRIERAKVLLAATKLSVFDIADRVGFSNQSHFTAQFRKLVGATPKQYRDCC
jgi:AraC family transcriptional regulator